MASSTRKNARNLAADRAAKGEPKLTITRIPEKDRAKLAARIEKLREAGASWPEIVAATGIPGGITGRKLVRAYGSKGAEKRLIAPSYDRSVAEANRAKAARAARPTAPRASSSRTKAGAAKNGKARATARATK
jgi:hypothetical protein